MAQRLAHATAYPGPVLTLERAATAAGVSRETLDETIRAGQIEPMKVRMDGHTVTVLPLPQLRRAFEARGQHGAAFRLKERIEVLESDLTEARCERDLALGTERATNRYADKLEAKLELARREGMTLARALGRAERDLKLLQAANAEQVGQVDQAPTPREAAAGRREAQGHKRRSWALAVLGLIVGGVAVAAYNALA